MHADTDADEVAVLVVGSDERYRRAVSDRLTAGGFSVRQTESARGAVEAFAAGAPDCVISDAALADSTGLRLLHLVRARDPFVPFVLLTADEDEAVDAVAADATDYVPRERVLDRSPGAADAVAETLRDAVADARRRRRHADEAARTRAVLGASRRGVVVVRDGRIEFANARARSLVGATDRTSLSGTRFENRFPVTDPSAMSDLLRAVSAGETAFETRRFELSRGDGTPVSVSVCAAPVDWEGKPAVALLVEEAAERMRLADELAMKSRAMDDAPLGITITDPAQSDNPVCYVNDGFCELTGYPTDEVLGRNCRFLQGEETDPETVATVREAIDAGEPVSVELLNYRRDGTPFWNALTVSPIRDGRGDVVNYVGFQQDVTERRGDRRDLRRFEQAVEAAAEAVFITDPDGTITYANPAFEDVTGYPPAEAIGRTPHLLNSGQHDEEYYERLWETILAKGVWRDEVVDRRKSGEVYYALQTISPIVVDGEVREFVGVQTDITERKEYERHLTTLDRLLRHDLRNRLNVIEGYADLLRSADVDADVAEYADRLTEATQELLAVSEQGREINELLLERPNRRVIEVVPLVREALARFERDTDGAAASLSVECDPSVEAFATDQVRDAFDRLLDYRAEHAGRHDPRVDVRVDTTPDGPVRVRFADDGEPIPSKESDVLTEVTEIDSLYHGTGLDLWFVYWIVRRSGGSVSFSREDERNVVTIELAAELSGPRGPRGTDG